MALRWIAAAMNEAKKGFRRLKAYKQLPALRGRAGRSLRKGDQQSRSCPNCEGRLTSFTATTASQSLTEHGTIPYRRGSPGRQFRSPRHRSTLTDRPPPASRQLESRIPHGVLPFIEVCQPETTTKFHCPNCGDEYLVVRVEAPPTHDETPLLCLGSDGPLCNREGKFALKYFRINDGSGSMHLDGRRPKLG
jgi:hypothetical protein